MTTQFCGWVIIVGWVFTASARADFDWRNVDGLDFTTPIRNQGATGTCWAFSTVAALESKFKIQSNRPEWDLDLSEQHLISSGCCGTLNYGWSSTALEYFVTNGITDEATLPFSPRGPSTAWPLLGSHRLYSVNEVEPLLGGGIPAGGYATETVKTALREHGPLIALIRTPDVWDTTRSEDTSGWQSDYPFDPPFSGCSDPELGGMLHSVAVVGYRDDPTVDSGGRWIVKNSWGPHWGDGGYGYVAYGVLEQRSAIRAITGETSWRTVPEPQHPLVLFALLILAGRLRPLQS